ncbi:hypothetical protein [Nesterenkonia rhizosphaerae]|uniref:Uncharacterized protein n=1 Tax=Nesterenkonia rhizosphaerae TaxID=1348272 RepID=A0ABP9G0J8_9MICC
MVDYSISRNDRGTTLTVYFSNGPLVFSPDHPHTDEAVELLLGSAQHMPSIEEDLRTMHDLTSAIALRLREVSTRFSLIGGQLCFDGDVIDKPLTRIILDRLHAGDESWEAYARFMIHLAQNPSQQARKALFRWISDRKLTLTRDGLIVAYKGVNDEGLSYRAGKGIVHRQVDGALITEQYTQSQLPNDVGTWVEFPRSEVDADPTNHCGVGLHVGSREFAEGFGSRLLTVLVNPTAVVMVPHDSNGQKMRVWQYYVTDIEPASASATSTVDAPVAFSPDEDQDCYAWHS